MNTPREWQRGLISDLLDREGVIAYPTEGVMGLGCLPESAHAVSHILALKQRSWTQGLLLVAADISQFEACLEGISPAERRQLEDSWPGPVTYLVPDNGVAPEWIVGSHETVGLRVSDHPVVRWLATLRGPLVSTSANIAGRPAARNALQVRHYFGRGVDFMVPGRLGQLSGPSTIRVLKTGATVR